MQDNPMYGSVPLDSFPEELSRKVFQYSANGHVPVTGIITALEVARRKNKNKRHMLFAAFGFFVCFVLVNMGLTYTVINMSKDLHVKNGLLTSSSADPVSTGTARSFTSVTSESTKADLSQVSHLYFETNATTINLPVNGYVKTKCPFGSECISENVLYFYTPEATVVYHGSEFIVANATERLQQAIGASFNGGRHLLTSCGWCVAFMTSGMGLVMGGAALAGPTGGVSLVVGIASGSAVMLTGLIGGLIYN